jgi:hypothetical protein
LQVSCQNYYFVKKEGDCCKKRKKILIKPINMGFLIKKVLALIIHNVLKITLKTRKLMGSVFEIILEKACFRRIATVAQKNTSPLQM